MQRQGTLSQVGFPGMQICMQVSLGGMLLGSESGEGKEKGGEGSREKERKKKGGMVGGGKTSPAKMTIYFSITGLYVCVWRSLGFLFIINDFVSDKIDGFYVQYLTDLFF